MEMSKLLNLHTYPNTAVLFVLPSCLFTQDKRQRDYPSIKA